jgi:hypothetical protein
VTKSYVALSVSTIVFLTCVVAAAVAGVATASAFETAADSPSFVQLPDVVDRELDSFWQWAFIALTGAIVAAWLIVTWAGRIGKVHGTSPATSWTVGLAILAPVVGTVVLVLCIMLNVDSNVA